MSYLVLAIRCLIGVVFLVSSVSKVIGRDAFGSFLASAAAMRIVRPMLVAPVATGVVAAEFGTAGALLLPLPGPVVTIGLALAAVLLGAFSVGIANAIRHRATVPCRCFGSSAAPMGTAQLARTAALAATAVVGCLAGRLASRTGPMHLDAAAGAALIGLTLGGLVTVLDGIVELFRPVGSQLSTNTNVMNTDVRRGHEDVPAHRR